MQKISFITTILNEERSIIRFLESIAWQTRLPDEIVVVDGGSKDKTIEKIREFNRAHPTLIIQIIKVSGLNRSQGRNFAIKKAKHSIIAASDAGCVLHKDWLKNITVPFEDSRIMVVAGAYNVITRTMWQKAPAMSTTVNFNTVNPKTFLPSSRSIAFRKSACEKVSGYPENLNTAEDLIFAQRLHKAKQNQVLAREAIVDWYPPTSTLKIVKQFFNYAYGDGLAGWEGQHFKRQLIKTFVLFLLVFVYTYSYISLFVLANLLVTWFALQAMRRSFSDPTFNGYGLVRGFYFWVHFIWGIILLPTTLLGFWKGVIESFGFSK